MTNHKKHLAKFTFLKFIFLFIVIQIIFIAAFWIYKKIPSEKKSDKIVISFADSLHNAEKQIIKADLNTYNYLSPNMISLIISEMDKASKEYKVPIGLLHSVFRVESEYKFWSTHKPVVVLINGKKIKTSAIGLGGIIWEFWQDSLKKHGIAEAKSDLYLPEVNIKATAYILRTITNLHLSNVNPNNHLYISYKIIKHYYGQYSDDYNSKILKATSDLWLKRIAFDLTSNTN